MFHILSAMLSWSSNISSSSCISVSSWLSFSTVTSSTSLVDSPSSNFNCCCCCWSSSISSSGWTSKCKSSLDCELLTSSSWLETACVSPWSKNKIKN